MSKRIADRQLRGQLFMRRRACFAQEQQAYDRLKPMWPQLPAEMAAHCEKIASFGGPGSYTLMEACVQQEMQVSGGKAGRTFKF
jgi:hypothetical protein